MGYRKIYLAIDCRDDEEAQRVQKVAEDMSSLFRLSAKDIINFYPAIKSNADLVPGMEVVIRYSVTN
jgi:hypothetical protein